MNSIFLADKEQYVIMLFAHFSISCDIYHYEIPVEKRIIMPEYIINLRSMKITEWTVLFSKINLVCIIFFLYWFFLFTYSLLTENMKISINIFVWWIAPYWGNDHADMTNFHLRKRLSVEHEINLLLWFSGTPHRNWRQGWDLPSFWALRSSAPAVRPLRLCWGSREAGCHEWSSAGSGEVGCVTWVRLKKNIFYLGSKQNLQEWR